MPERSFLFERFRSSPLLVRVAPFFIFLGLTYGQGQFGATSPYWVYLAKTLVGGWLLLLIRPFVLEMRWAISWEAILVGVGVALLWVGLDDFYPKLASKGSAWNPFVAFNGHAALAWGFVGERLLGSSLIVPPLEEVFYRSFLYRYLAKPDFLSVPMGRMHRIPFVVTGIIFGLEHHQWLAGILCGFAYQALVCRKRRLGDAITAHAITNFLLGLWVIWRGAWGFW